MTGLPSYAVDYRGHPACPCQVRWLPVFELEAQRRGILTGPLPLSQLIGGDPRSGGTHTDGGADDTYPLIGVNVVLYVALSREMGADATWYRPFNWDGKDGVAHVHRVLTDCPHNGPARYQIDAVRAGFNGLGTGGRGAPDNGPRPLSGRTWREGIAWATALQEEHEMTPDQAQTLDQIAKDVTALTKRVDVIGTRAAKRDKAVADELEQIAGKVTDTATKGQLRKLAQQLAASDSPDEG